MQTIDVKSLSFKKILEKYTGKKFEDIEIIDLEKITNISICAKDYLGNHNYFDLEELKLLPNLKDLTISKFIIGEVEIKNLSSLNKLLSLNFDFCAFTGCNISLNNNLKYLYFNCPKSLDVRNIASNNIEMLKVVCSSNIEQIDISNFNCFYKLKELCLNKYSLINLEQYSIKFPNLLKLNIDGSIAEFDKNLLKNRIAFSAESEYHVKGM